MRISDWSSDVCSSDLYEALANALREPTRSWVRGRCWQEGARAFATAAPLPLTQLRLSSIFDLAKRSEERRVGKECVSTCRSRWTQYPEKKNNNIDTTKYRQNQHNQDPV